MFDVSKSIVNPSIRVGWRSSVKVVMLKAASLDAVSSSGHFVKPKSISSMCIYVSITFRPGFGSPNAETEVHM